MFVVFEFQELFFIVPVLYHYKFGLQPFPIFLDVRLRKLAGEKEELLSQVKAFFSLEGNVGRNGPNHGVKR